MDILLKKKVDLMIENFYQLKNGFKWDAHLLKHFGAMVYATKEKNIDIETIEEVKSYIKSETGWCSQFRGMNIFILASLLSLEKDYKSFFKDMLEIYDRMKEKGFSSSQYLPLATYTIVKEVQKEYWDYSIKRMKLFYDNMKKNHFWLTSHDDYVFAAVLATTDLEVELTSRKIEECYKLLNESGFYKGNDLQTLSHILAIGEEETQQKCRKAKEIYNGLANNKCKLQYSGLATLGLITLVTNDTDKIVSKIT